MSTIEPTQSSSHTEEISIKEVIRNITEWMIFLRKRWVIIFFAGFLGAGIGLGYAVMQKATYTATLTFALEDDKSGGAGGLSGALGLASSLGVDLGGGSGGAFSGSNLIELMKSRKLVEQALLDSVTVNGKLMSFAEMYIQYNELRKAWKLKAGLNEKLQFLPNVTRSQYTLEQDSILGIIYEKLIKNNVTIAQQDKKVSILNIDVKTTNELFSKKFAEVLANEVSSFYVETKSKKSKMNVAILERQVDSIRRELNNAIGGVAIVNDNTFNLNPALNSRRSLSAIRQVDVQANTAILIELEKNLELSKIALRKETPLIQVIDMPILPLKKEKVGKLNSIIIGGLLGGFLALVVIIFKKLWRSVMNK